MNLSIRARAALYFAAAAGGMLTLFALTLFWAVSAGLRADFRERMTKDFAMVFELFREERRLNQMDEFRHDANELNLHMQVQDMKGNVVFESDSWKREGMHLAPLDKPMGADPVWRSILSHGKSHRVLSRASLVEADEPPMILHLAQSDQTLDDVRAKLLRWSLILIPIMIVLCVGGGFWFARQALRPIDAIRRQADAIGSGDLSARLPIPAQRDELYWLTRTLNGMLERIEASFRNVKRFTADASHELRVPLTALRGTLELALRRERSPEAYREAIADALEETERLSRLAQDLLMLARVEAQAAPTVKQPVALRAFLTDIFEAAQGLNVDGKVRMELADIPEITLSLDPDQIRRVIFNLIDNAIKYTRPGGDIRVSAETGASHCDIHVSDTGEGIDPEHQEAIFDRFFRVDKARSRQAGGTGLGLSIARSLAESHGGRLTVESTPGKGSVFTLRLPLH